MNQKKFVYMFTETDETMRNLVGGKGANLGQMTKLGLPIPQGFTVTTEACTYYYEHEESISAEMVKEIETAMAKLEEITGKKFGCPENPLLVSVISSKNSTSSSDKYIFVSSVQNKVLLFFNELALFMVDLIY